MQLSTVLTPELQGVWEFLHQWIVLTQSKGSASFDDKEHLKLGQMLLDRLRIKQAVMKGADPQYVETHYGNQRDPTDQLGTMLATSIQYNRSRGRSYTTNTRGMRRPYATRRYYDQPRSYETKPSRPDFYSRGSGGTK